MIRLAAVFRIALLLLLGVALWLTGGTADHGGDVFRIPASGGGVGDARVRGALAGVAAGLVVRESGAAPGDAELEVLGALALRARLLTARPSTRAALRAGAPDRPRAGRASAVHFAVSAPDDDSVLVRLADDAGPLDSAWVMLDAGGVARGAFRVRPEREGWHDWIVSAGVLQARTGAWVRAAEPPRVLVAAGPPDWESRFVARALEEAGAAVTLAQPLGRGLASGGGPAGLPAPASSLSPYDAVLILAGASVSAQQVRALVEYVDAEGGGLLVVGQPATAAAFGITMQPQRAAASASDLHWVTPAEIVPLPAAEIDVDLRPLTPASPTALTAAGAPGGDVLVLATRGRGRAGAFGISDTWRWRMQAGRVEEHRAFWRSLVDWLANGARDSIAVRLPQHGATGGRVAVEVRGAAEDAELFVRRPDGREERLASGPAAAGRATTFLAAEPGVHVLRVRGSAEVAAFEALSDSAGAAVPSADAHARLALLAHASGGGAFDADGLEAAVDRFRTQAGRASPPAGLLFALLVLLALGEWVVRRTTGRP